MLWRVPVSRRYRHAGEQFLRSFRHPAIEDAFAHFLGVVRPQLVHFQHLQDVSAQLIALAAGRPRVMTLHDYWPYCPNGQLLRPSRLPCDHPAQSWYCADCALHRAGVPSPLARAVARTLVALPMHYRQRTLRRRMEQIDLFLSPSAFLREQYVAQGFPTERIRVIELGLDVQRLAAPGRVSLPLPPVRPHFGFLGSFVWQKGVHVLVEAFNTLPPAATLTIYGPEQAAPEYVAAVKASARHPHLRFGGPLDPHDVGAALRQLDGLVVPSVWYENSPVVIQEAYGVGVPVIASRLGALPEKVQEGVTGRLFAPGDSADLARVLREVIAAPEQLAAFRANLRPAPSLDEHATQIAALYRELLAGGG
jgi:glycosyltransferase involved in cell wall biosynthesis